MGRPRSFLFPGYTGHRPRLQHWHGTADTTLSYDNVAEDIKEWTNLLGLDDTPTGTDTPTNGTTHQFWTNACGYTVYETFALSGVGHAVPFDGNAVAAYFGLDHAGGEDPETAACPGAVPGDGGTGGTGGVAGSGGAAATGGASGSGAAPATGGVGGASGGVAGAAGGSGVVDTGGSPQTGGTSGTGAALETGGSGLVATGGGSAAGGAATTGGGPAATGGTSNTGGIGGSGGMAAAAATGSGGAPATGAASGLGGDGASSASSTEEDTDADGCSCKVGGHTGDFGTKAATLLLAALGLRFGRRRRRTAGDRSRIRGRRPHRAR